MNKDNLKKIEEIIESFFFSEDDLNKKVITAANEAIKNGGKRLRPLIMFETYKAVAGAEYNEGIIAPFLAAVFSPVAFREFVVFGIITILLSVIGIFNAKNSNIPIISSTVQKVACGIITIIFVYAITTLFGTAIS